MNRLRGIVATIAAAAVEEDVRAAARALAGTVPRPARGVAAGLDVLIEEGFRPIAGRKIGLVTNATGRARDGRPAVEVLTAAKGGPPRARVERWTHRLLFEVRANRARLSILLCGDRRMQTLNRRFRRVDSPTDVLSFPAFDASESRAAARRGAFLGDLVIDVPYAARQARRRGHPVGREVQILLAHGLLHLLGYDHETDGGTMFRLQRRILLSAFGEGPDGAS